MEQTFEPMPDIPMDKSFTLEQLTGRFQNVRDGLPELPKNSKDQYVRLGIDNKDLRQILVIVSQDNSRVGVLDFGGARETDFEGWHKWSSRDAGRTALGTEIEAGYGNGGKAFMVRGSERESFMCGLADGKLTKMGFKNDDPSLRYKPGWYRDGENGLVRSLPAIDPRVELNKNLEHFGVSINDLPPSIQNAFNARKSFTFVVVDGVKEWVNSGKRDAAVRRLPYDLMSHPQMALTVDTCSVWVLRGSSLLFPGPLKLEPLDPLLGFETPVRITVPDSLVDPQSDDAVTTGPKGDKFLELKTSGKNLRLGGNRPLNVIRIRNSRNVVGNWSIAELVPMATSGFIYGTLKLPALEGQHLAGAERQSLADTPLTRGVREWVEENVRDLATKIQRAQMAREKEEDRDVTNDALRRIREIMRKFLDVEPAGTGRNEYGSIVHEIVLEQGKDELIVPVGTTVPLVFKCYERDKDRRLPVLKARVHLVADPLGVVSFNGFGSIRAERAGVCTAHLEKLDGTVRSNQIYIRAVEVANADLTGPPGLLKQGEIVQLGIRAEATDGSPVQGAVWEFSVDELDLGRVGRTGVFSAGRVEGPAIVQVKYGQTDEAISQAKVVVGPEKVERQPPNRGDIPLLLLCGTTAPGREDLPEGQRTHPPGAEYPTIIDFDPQWENVVWLNLQSPEAHKVRQSKGGTSGATKITAKVVYQFLALKCFEVLRRLKVRQLYEDQQVTANEFLRAMSEVETGAAGFLDATYKLVDNLMDDSDDLGG